MKKIFSNILIIIGIMIIMIPIIGTMYNKYQQQIIINKFELSNHGNGYIIKKHIEKNKKLKLHEEKLTNIKDNILLSESSIIGIIKIPKIKVNLPIVEGVSESELSWAIGHMDETVMPGETGNSALAGHRSDTFSEFFNRLDELEIGDYIYIKTKDEIQKYNIYSKKVVNPTDLTVLKSLDGESIVTLITCHPIYSSKKRLIVQGKLIFSEI